MNDRKIMEAAISLFAEKGFYATSVREIVGRAGVTKPTLYYYFANKDALGQAILETAENLMREATTGVESNDSEGADLLVDFVEGQFEACRAHPDLARFLYALSYTPRRSASGFELEKFHRYMKSANEQVVRRAVEDGVIRAESAEVAAKILAGIVNFHLMAFLNYGEKLTREVAESAVGLLLEGAGPRDGND